jgi:transcriptional regulator with XRE-family HTH domain
MKDASPARLSVPRGTVVTTPPLEAQEPTVGRLQGPPAEAEMSRVLGKGGRPVVLLRQEIGDVLRDARRRQGRTLREVSSVARVSLGYLSEVERGQKEASSELLASICGALDVPLSSVLHTVSRRVAEAEHVPHENLGVADLQVPDTVPDNLAAGVNLRDGLVSAA